VGEVVRIPGAVLDRIAAHAWATRPDECCGLLVGPRDDGAVHDAIPTTNQTPSPTGYRIDPAEHFAAIRAARAEGRRIVGAYHSHPGAPAVPSRRDLDEAWFPDFLYVIVSVTRAGEAGDATDIRAYRLTPAAATPVEIVRVSGAEGIAAADPDDA
jgi:proteasome lid subunit RPN8/RPN11